MKKLSITFIFTIFISLTSCSSITKYFGSSNIKIDETGVVNFIRYLEGRFYAENTIIDRSSRIMSPMYYAVSEDGKNSYGWFCNSTSSYDCNDNFLAFKTVEYCKEYSKKNCYIFAIKNEIVWKNLNIKVEELSFSKNIELFKKLNLYNATSKSIVNQANYQKYVFLDDDDCKDKKNYKDLSSTRGASLFCMLIGRYEDRKGSLNF
jgi:hypothetical protein